MIKVEVKRSNLSLCKSKIFYTFSVRTVFLFYLVVIAIVDLIMSIVTTYETSNKRCVTYVKKW